MNRLLSLLLALVCCDSAPARETRPTSEQTQFFEAKVRPLFVTHCLKCHGPKKQQGGLRLDTAAGFRAGGDTGALIHTSKPEQSLLLRAVRHEGPRMPPKNKLAPADVAILAQWIKMGAPWPATTTNTRSSAVVTADDRTFWSFQPVRLPTVPVVRNSALARTPIDHFLLQKLEEKGLSYNPSADRRALLRRLTYDLTGLPPTPEEVEAFVRDSSADAYEKQVDRLLASPAYGERWGRHWLDVVRYADTAGDNSDYPVPQLYKYRNWVLNAFNRDQPFDRFIIEQLAGDLLSDRTNEQLIATGYLASARRFGSYEDKRYQWYLTFEDTIENLGRSFLGLSLSCSRCHDHKFDPIPSEDYYALYGFFQSTRYPWPGIELDKVQRDLIPLDPPDRVATIKQERDAQLTRMDDKIRQLEASPDAKKPEGKRALAEAKKARNRLSKTPLPVDYAYAVAEGKRWVGNARMQMRGDPGKLGREVPRRFLQVLGGQSLPSDIQGSGRLQLARWIADPGNSLTARVLVNRLWLYHFGKGLVPTPNDFGRQGQPPTHPELLDWLASEFVQGDWSIKRMHRLILLSHAYQQSGEDSSTALNLDPDNQLYGRFPRRRLDAEAIRDTLLQLAGALDRSVGGAHPFPEQPTWDFTQHKPFKAVYETDRRSVYLMTQRIQRHPYLAIFDGADTNASTARRDSSTTPLQALYLMNDPLVHRLANGFANRLLREPNDDERIERSFLLAFARSPRDEERATVRAFLQRVRETLEPSRLSKEEREMEVWRSYVRSLFLSNELVYIN
jgi:mono/diheme cytochrome c family protein